MIQRKHNCVTQTRKIYALDLEYLLQLFLYMIPYIGGDKLFVKILVEFAEIFAD